MTRLPIRLGESPLTEAVFELRFQPKEDRLTDLLPGLLYESVASDFPKAERLPLGLLPKEMKEKHPEIAYSPAFRMSGEGQAMLLGERVLAVSILKPYRGWSQFRELCLRVASAVERTGHIHQLERYSLKYVNVLDNAPDPAASPIQMFNIDLKLHGLVPTHTGFILRFETVIDELTNIVEMHSSTTVENDREVKNGAILSLDTIEFKPGSSFWREAQSRIDRAHGVIKNLFYSLLTPATLAALKPSYEDTK